MAYTNPGLIVVDSSWTSNGPFNTDPRFIVATMGVQRRHLYEDLASTETHNGQYMPLQSQNEPVIQFDAIRRVGIE
ncbi:hypothetical protein PIIN_09316 [Serendipita indica DSM 11827]|uniref:Uncharacterized protein n=1 Tax=Serendipita indica (strain DSM 11827) TaxID=1109443 RepID=G4TVI8_SERID|nr:hypothetical protein PIIN_09316 [Serendipita indica DSM 11827]